MIARWILVVHDGEYPQEIITSHYSSSFHLVELIGTFISVVNRRATFVCMMRRRTRKLRNIVSIVGNKIGWEEQSLRYTAQATAYSWSIRWRLLILGGCTHEGGGFSNTGIRDCSYLVGRLWGLKENYLGELQGKGVHCKLFERGIKYNDWDFFLSNRPHLFTSTAPRRSSRN